MGGAGGESAVHPLGGDSRTAGWNGVGTLRIRTFAVSCVSLWAPVGRQSRATAPACRTAAGNPLFARQTGAGPHPRPAFRARTRIRARHTLPPLDRRD